MVALIIIGSALWAFFVEPFLEWIIGDDPQLTPSPNQFGTPPRE